jgi:pimeloyl-ACP methyl ester carboxylesterase
LPDIVRVADMLQWSTFDVIGHSRGAIISALLAAALPERVSGAVLLDGLRPHPVSEENFAQQLGLFLREHLAPKRLPPLYDSFEYAVKLRARAAGMNEASAALIAKRGLTQIETGWYWHHDPRLRFASAVKMTQADIDGVMKRFAQIPHRVFCADRGAGAVLKEYGELERWSSELNFEVLGGGHHFHMEESAPELAAKIDIFWRECRQ